MTLTSVIEYLRNDVAPRASEIDANPTNLKQALAGLCSLSAMALKRPEEYGGPGVSEVEFREFQEEVARASGALAFLQTQHQSAVSMIAKSSNANLKREWLPRMDGREALMGIGFSQLRRFGPPLMTAHRSGAGYLLNGTVPWITGFGFYDWFIVGATLNSGEALFGIVPFGTKDSQIELSPPMSLAAMESAQTVSAKINNYFLDDDLVVDIKPADWIHVNDMLNITLQGFFALGCARAALDVIHSEFERRKREFLFTAWRALDAELTCLRQLMVQASTKDGDRTTPKKLALRAHAIELCVRCSHAAITASGGGANSLKHPAQRIYREALVYTVSAQTEPIMEATLDRLARHS